ncbi:MAG: glycerol-3-phosphate dehydrogenase C-terminal domain-containing protein, partial [Thermoplasmata archaeon]
RDLRTPPKGEERSPADGVPEGKERGRDRGKAIGLGRETLDHLALAFGLELPELYASLEKEALRDLMTPDLPYVRGEAVYAVRHEMALRLEDVLARRTRVMEEDPNHGLRVAEDIARLMGEHLGWDSTRIAEEVESYSATVAANEAFRKET